MGADAILEPVEDGPDFQIDGLEGAEGAFDLGQAFV